VAVEEHTLQPIQILPRVALTPVPVADHL